MLKNYFAKLSKTVLYVAAVALTLALGTFAVGQGVARERALVVGTSFNLVTLDPARAFELTAILTNKALYETLVTLPDDGQGQVQPQLATSWTVSPDGLTYTFKLREAVKFSSGNPLSAADVAWSIERFKGLKGPASFLADTIVNVSAPDEQTVVIQLGQPDPALLSKLTVGNFAVLDSKLLSANGAASGPDADRTDQAEAFLNGRSAGTGPYVLQSADLASEIVLARNPNYWRAPAPLETYVLRNIPDAAVQRLSLEANDIDVALDLTADQAQLLQANPQVRVLTPPSLITLFLGFNKDPKLSGSTVNQIPVQRAVQLALDYEGIRNLGGPGSVTPATVIPLGINGALDPSLAPSQDLSQARQLLDQAGFANGFEISLEYPGGFVFGGVDFDVLAQKVQADLAEVGVQVTLAPSQVDTFFTRLRAGQAPFFISFWTPDFLDALNYTAFLPGGTFDGRTNWSVDSDTSAYQTLKQLKAQAEVATDEAKRAELFRQIQQLLQESGPFAPLLQPALTLAIRADLQGFVFNPQWRIDPYIVSR